MLTEIGAAVGTFAGLTWFGVNVAPAVVGLIGVSPVDHGLPGELAWTLVIATAALGTLWLERGGYQRLGASACGGLCFAWLALLALPSTFLPAAVASTSVLAVPVTISHLYFAACVILAAWLALFGGLERISLDATTFLPTALLALGGSLGVLLVDAIVADGFVTVTAPVPAHVTLAIVALGWQALVLCALVAGPWSLERTQQTPLG